MNKHAAFHPLLSIIIAGLLAGCGRANPPDQTLPTPVRPDPTSTVTPISADSGPIPSPTSIISEQVALSDFTHSTNRFSIRYPANWQSFERTDGVALVEPGDQGGISVFFSDAGETYSAEELNQYLVTFVAQNFVDEDSGFSAIKQEGLADGSVVAQFATTDPNLGPTINEVRVWQHDTILYTLLTTISEEQWQISQDRLQAVTDSFTPLDTAPIATAAPTEEAPVWDLIGSTRQEFGFLYPSDWEIVNQDEGRVVVKMPEVDVTFEGSVFDWPGAEADPAGAAEEAALAYLTTIEEQQSEVQHRALTEFPLDTESGATIDFVYKNGEGVFMAGSVITAASDGRIYQVVFTAPASYYETALAWFNPMYQSFKILAPEENIFDVQ